jgi:UBX domain-containing protein 6
MASIKKFFEKKRQDAKFKKLGQGHKLTEESSPQSPSAGGPRATAGAPPPRDLNQTETQRAAALAAVARLDRQSQKQNPQWSKTFIRAEAKKQAAAQEGASQSASRTGPVELEGPGALATSGVYFKCPIIGPEVFPKDDMIAKIRAFLYEQYEEEPALTSVLIIFSLNNPSKVRASTTDLTTHNSELFGELKLVPPNRVLLFEFFFFLKTTIIAPKVENNPVKEKMRNFSVLPPTTEFRPK